jgi:toxin ParE1/3/4
MAKYHLSNKAVADLISIWDYTVRVWSKRQAERYYNQIISACSELSTKPQNGKRYSEIRSELLGFKSGKHIIFYKILSKNEIVIYRILHEQMDLDYRLLE